ncbi:DUF6538 domain-containing protein [Methylorubrum extorquens]
MALAMVRPWKHKSGIYYLRRRVPDDLKAALGVAEIRRSLDTRDAVEAKRRFVRALVELDVQWANLRRGPQALSEREARALALPYEERHLAEHYENPSAQCLWNSDLYPSLWKLEPLVPLDPTKSMSELFVEGFDVGPARRQAMRRWCESETDQCLERHGLRVDEARAFSV